MPHRCILRSTLKIPNTTAWFHLYGYYKKIYFFSPTFKIIVVHKLVHAIIICVYQKYYNPLCIRICCLLIDCYQIYSVLHSKAHSYFLCLIHTVQQKSTVFYYHLMKLLQFHYPHQQLNTHLCHQFHFVSKQITTSYENLVHITIFWLLGLLSHK